MNTFVKAVLIIIAGAQISRADTPSTVWIRQFGTNALDQAFGLSSDSLGNLYVAGSTYGSLAALNNGDSDAFVTSFDSAGNLRWSRQRGTSGLDTYYGAAADSLGGVYLTGITEGSFGGSSAGRYDSFLAKYDTNGAFQWASQFGTPQDDFSFSVSLDETGSPFVVGETSGGLVGALAGSSDAFLLKYAATGSSILGKQIGSSGSERAQSVFADKHGSVFLTGGTDGVLGQANAGGTDVIVAKYASSGALGWLRQFGSNQNQVGRAVTADTNGNVYVVGNTDGNLAGPSAGGVDSFMAKYDSQGTQLWIKQFGTNASDDAEGVIADGAGNIYVSGNTRGAFGSTYFGGMDAYLAKFNADGAILWVYQFGTALDDAVGNGQLVIDNTGDVYLSGYTSGSLGGASAGSSDSFLIRIRSIPEPSSLMLVCLMAVILASKSRRRTTSILVCVFR